MLRKMFKKMNIAMLLALVLFLSACNAGGEEAETETESAESTEVQDDQEQADDDDHDHDHGAAEDVELADWAGEWNNMGAYFDLPEVQESFEKVAEEEGKTVEEVKEYLEERRHCDFDGLVIDGNKIKFLDGFPADGGNVIDEAEYTLGETIEASHGGSTLYWHEFKAEGDAKYPVILLMDIHGEEDLIHYHLRYGDNSEELMENDGWYPTFVKENSTIEQIKDEIEE